MTTSRMIPLDIRMLKPGDLMPIVAGFDLAGSDGLGRTGFDRG
jgi:hypothetical protein